MSVTAYQFQAQYLQTYDYALYSTWMLFFQLVVYPYWRGLYLLLLLVISGILLCLTKFVGIIASYSFEREGGGRKKEGR